MKKKAAIITACVAVALIVASGQYVHRGYVGVIESGESLGLLDHGLHFKAPWKPVTIYPIRSRDTHVEAYYDGPRGKIHFDGVILLSVCPDSVVSLHRAYHGAYMQELVTPRVMDFLREYGDAYRIRDGQYKRQEVADAIARHLNLALAEHGINVYSIWLGTVEIVTDSLGDPAP